MGRRTNLAPYLFLLPAVVLMLVFVYIPVIESFRFSLFKWNSFSPEWTWVGLGNYRKLLPDPIFWQSIGNNIWYAIISVAIQVFLALMLAALLESHAVGRRLSTFFRTSLFLPAVLAITIVGVTWQMLYRPDTGLINQVLHVVGLDSWTRAWLGEERTAIFSVIAVSQWQSLGYLMVLLIVAIRAVPRELYEAARIDGAGIWRQFRDVTVPGVRETTLVLVIITVVGAFKVFDVVWVMTAGGPNHASEVLGTFLYRTAFRDDEMGYASAIATMLFFITFALAAVQLWAGRSGKDA
ncbi:MAG: sugar ABC transporter permease [Thermomicrobiales bacterium]|nr:sugar ABC transporter permease [Thermomicrobiales bacterium]